VHRQLGVLDHGEAILNKLGAGESRAYLVRR
jgi:hypothetical protein